jgi:uncharacterized membrane protein YuzA (DUF378 family)
MKMSVIGWIAFVLVIVGGLNWGLVGLLNFDLVAFLFGSMSLLARIVYSLVGVGALYMIISAATKKA